MAAQEDHARRDPPTRTPVMEVPEDDVAAGTGRRVEAVKAPTRSEAHGHLDVARAHAAVA